MREPHTEVILICDLVKSRLCKRKKEKLTTYHNKKTFVMATTKNNKDLRSNVTCARVARWVKGGNIATMRALSHSSFHSVLCLDDMRLLLVKNFRVPLVAAAIFDQDSLEKNVKEFCGELLDRCTRNHWKTIIRSLHLSLRDRCAIASSLFSVRKLVTTKKPDPMAYVRKMTTPQEPLDPAFAMFCSAEIGRIFETGWDRKYWSKVESFTPPNKSNREKKEKGTYRQQAVRDPHSRDVFRRWAGGTVTSPIDARVRATAVLTAGKWRVITLSDPALTRLLPVHQTLYDRLTKEKWLLRGEAVPSAFSDFKRVEGEVFVSGDYEGATDNLNINLTELVLRRLFDSSTHIPTRVKEEALASLRLSFVDVRGRFCGQQSAGQLMGSPISFPLLCLINYLTFKYAVRREVPVKINGDDIIFRSTCEESLRWFELVKASGLVVSKGKTVVARRFFSLNSSYFLASDSGADPVSHIRASNVLKKCEDMTSLAGRVAQVRRDLPVGAIRENVLMTLVRRNLHVVYPSQGSFSRRYLSPIPGKVLRALRLVERESFYRSLPSEPPSLKPWVFLRQEVVPKNWTKESKVMRGFERVPDAEVSKTFVEGAWCEPLIEETKNEYWQRVRDTSMRFVSFAKKTYRLYRKFVGRNFSPTHFQSYQKKRGFWVKEKSEGPLGPVAFRLGGVE